MQSNIRGGTLLDLPEGQINDPLSGKYFSLPFLPATPSSPSQTLDSPFALPPELQIYKDTIRCGELGAKVPVHGQKQLTKTLIVHLLKNAFFSQKSLIVKSEQNSIALVTRSAMELAAKVRVDLLMIRVAWRQWMQICVLRPGRR